MFGPMFAAAAHAAATAGESDGAFQERENPPLMKLTPYERTAVDDRRIVADMWACPVEDCEVVDVYSNVRRHQSKEGHDEYTPQRVTHNQPRTDTGQPFEESHEGERGE